MEKKKGREMKSAGCNGFKEEMKKCMWQVRKEGNRWAGGVASGQKDSNPVCVCGQRRERKRKREGTSRPLEGRGMPGPGTVEWDGGWSMFTLLLPTEHIPTTESWRLFNLQIIKPQHFYRRAFPLTSTVI